MNLKVYILLLAGCVFYLESQKGTGFIHFIFLLGSYVFIPASVLEISTGFFKEAEKVKVKIKE